MRKPLASLLVGVVTLAVAVCNRVDNARFPDHDHRAR